MHTLLPQRAEDRVKLAADAVAWPARGIDRIFGPGGVVGRNPLDPGRCLILMREYYGKGKRKRFSGAPAPANW